MLNFKITLCGLFLNWSAITGADIMPDALISGYFTEYENQNDTDRSLKKVLDDYCTRELQIPSECVPSSKCPKHNKADRHHWCYFDYRRNMHFKCCPRLLEKACKHFNQRGEQINVGGSKIETNEFSFMVALGWDTDGAYTFHCGGALIHYRWVLTAAHCNDSNGPVVVVPGGVDLDDRRVKPTPIKTIIQHWRYKPPEVYNDIALIRLAKPLLEYKPACIVSRLPMIYNRTVLAIGYGARERGGEPSNHLSKSSLVTMQPDVCRMSYLKHEAALPEGLRNTQLCARDKQFKAPAACDGDSGSPLVLKRGSSFYVAGITSYGTCRSIGIYTNVTVYFRWIEEWMRHYN